METLTSESYFDLGCRTDQRAVKFAFLRFYDYRFGGGQVSKSISFGFIGHEFTTEIAGTSVRNPHVTYHHPLRMHVTENGKGKEYPVIVIQPVSQMLETDGAFPWIEATTKQLGLLKEARPRPHDSRYDNRGFFPSGFNETSSIIIDIDFYAPRTRPIPAIDRLDVVWGDVGVRVKYRAAPAQRPDIELYTYS